MHGWMLALVIVVGVIWLLLTWFTVVLVAEAVRTWRGDRRRQRQLTDAAMRYQAKRELQHRIRDMVDDERRRQLTAAMHTRRSSRSDGLS